MLILVLEIKKSQFSNKKTCSSTAIESILYKVEIKNQLNRFEIGE